MSLNELLVKAWYNQMWNNWDLSQVKLLTTTDIIFRGSLGQDKIGHQGLIEYIRFVKIAFEDFRNSIEEIISENNKSFVRLQYTGTHTGEIFGIAPTYKKVSYSGAALFTFKEDKIANVWVLGDLHNLLNQLKL